MDLAHIPDMRHHRQTELARQKAHCKKLGDARHASAIHLYKVNSTGLHEVLKHNSIGNVFTESDGNGCNRLRKRSVCLNVVRVRGLLDEVGRNLAYGLAEPYCLRQSPLLV